MERSRRPRLAAHVLARRHLVDGRERVVLHDTQKGRLVELGPREWGLLAAADGTRDVDGILLAAARDGAHARAPALVAFLDQLDAAGMIDDASEASLDERDGEGSREGVQVDPSRAVEPLAGFTLVCDGRGSCCRLYASVLFGPLEAARARVLMPQVLDADRHDRVFTPERGSAPTAGSAVAIDNGRCVYLGPSGLCRLHAAGGAGAKPKGCSAFPATFVDDGEVVRVSVAVECACVLASAGRIDGAPLLGDEVKQRRDLDPAFVVTELPPRVRVSLEGDAPRADFVAWSRRALDALTSRPSLDVALAFQALADALEGGTLADVDSTGGASAPLDRAHLFPWVRALHARAGTRAREDAGWRSPLDLARRATAWIEQACALLLADDTWAFVAQPRKPDAEALYARAVLHGHQLAGEWPVSIALRDRAVRLLVARALDRLLEQTPSEPHDSATLHPLALVEAMLRGHGLDAYVHDV